MVQMDCLALLYNLMVPVDSHCKTQYIPTDTDTHLPSIVFHTGQATNPLLNFVSVLSLFLFSYSILSFNLSEVKDSIRIFGFALN